MKRGGRDELQVYFGTCGHIDFTYPELWYDDPQEQMKNADLHEGQYPCDRCIAEERRTKNK